MRCLPDHGGQDRLCRTLKNGPVMIGGAAGQRPAQWLLATGMTPDGKDINLHDPQPADWSNSPRQKPSLHYRRFNPKTNGFSPLADAGSDIPANDASGLAGLQSFVPSTYYAVTVH